MCSRTQAATLAHGRLVAKNLLHFSEVSRGDRPEQCGGRDGG
jgi:hypothetical protein